MRVIDIILEFSSCSHWSIMTYLNQAWVLVRWEAIDVFIRLLTLSQQEAGKALLHIV